LLKLSIPHVSQVQFLIHFPCASVMQESNEANLPSHIDRPWWMMVHGSEPAVTKVDEVMEQFLDDTDMVSLHRLTETATKRNDVKSVAAVCPNAGQEDIDQMADWTEHLHRFLTYRGVLQEKVGQTIRRRPNKKRNARPSRFTSDSGSEHSDNESLSSSSPSEVHSPRSPQNNRQHRLKGRLSGSSFPSEDGNAILPRQEPTSVATTTLPLSARRHSGEAGSRQDSFSSTTSLSKETRRGPLAVTSSRLVTAGAMSLNGAGTFRPTP